MIGRSSLGEASSKRRRSARLAPITDTQVTELTTPKGKTKARSRATKAEIEAEVERLRAKLFERDAEIDRLRDETVAQDTGRVLELEDQIAALRAKLQKQPHPAARVEGEDGDGDVSDVDGVGDLPSRTFYDWTLAARDPYWDGYLDGGDDSGDITMTDVAFSTPSRRRKSADAAQPRSLSGSFPTPPCTSPTMPATPFSVHKPTIAKTPSHIDVQESLPDLEKESLKEELASLHLELAKLKKTLETQKELQDHVAHQLSIAAPLASSTGSGEGEQLELEDHLDLVLQQLRDRTVSLIDINSSLKSLGFYGSDASEIIGSITSGLRMARLEIEYITPGEISLPLSCHGAELLNLVLDHLRELSQQVKNNEMEINEYHEIEFSLRQQLGDRVGAMDNMKEKQEADAAALRERDSHIEDLEHSLDRLKGASRGYEKDIKELQSWMECMESEAKLAKMKLQIDLEATQEKLSHRDSVIGDLEAKLANTMEMVEAQEAELKNFHLRRDGENRARNTSHGSVLAIKDKRIQELRREINGINTCLRNAHESAIRMQRDNVVLGQRWGKAEDETKCARETIELLKVELQKVTASAAAAAKRRKHDSGVGLLEGDDADLIS